ncbi:alpha/beta hydrolase [Nocardioides pyridinolyticus]
MRPTVLGVLSALVAVLFTAPATGAAAPRAHERIESRGVVFDVENTNATSVRCLPDNQSYELRGRIIGTPRVLDGLGGSTRVNVLVHDIGTGAWFWNLRGRPSYDYATKLARAGETVLVLDRLGYGASPLEDGTATCLGAQADMLHQVVQHLTSGRWDYTDPADGTAFAAAHVVTHGHGVGAAIVQLEASEFDDVAGLVLMSWADTGPTSLAARYALRQGRECLDTDFAPFAATRADFRHIMFSSAPAAVQRAAARRKSDDPCGDVATLAGLALGSGFGADRVDAPVLLLYGADDKLIRPSARARQAEAYPTKTTMKVFKGAGSALPLERSAAQVRTTVLRWLD